MFEETTFTTIVVPFILSRNVGHIHFPVKHLYRVHAQTKTTIMAEGMEIPRISDLLIVDAAAVAPTDAGGKQLHDSLLLCGSWKNSSAF